MSGQSSFIYESEDVKYHSELDLSTSNKRNIDFEDFIICLLRFKVTLLVAMMVFGHVFVCPFFCHVSVKNHIFSIHSIDQWHNKNAIFMVGLFWVCCSNSDKANKRIYCSMIPISHSQFMYSTVLVYRIVQGATHKIDPTYCAIIWNTSKFPNHPIKLRIHWT